MANDEHLRVLKQGVDAWNQWREYNPRIEPDLSGAHLIKANLSRANLSEVDLSEAKLTAANLRFAKLTRADLRGTDLSGSNLNMVDFSGADLGWANRCGVVLPLARGLMPPDIRLADLGGADLTGAQLSELNLSYLYLTKANLVWANLSRSDLRAAFLGKANLSHANLSGVDLRNADLSGANLTRANLNRSNLTGTFLSGADLSESRFGLTTISGLKLEEAKGLESIFHNGPSYVGIDVIYNSGHKVPKVFFRGAGVPENLLKYMPDLIGEAIQFYSCFISYSTRDQDFAERLHADLQENGVRCWFAPEDIKGGRKLHEQIPEAIRLYDKLLLVLSENSMTSEWVRTEIHHARQDEIRLGKRKLFPIGLVQFNEIRNWVAFDVDFGKDMAREIREYFIPDFSNWKDHDSYKKAFDRLMQDLEAAD